jgi:hypothetical protein
MNKVSYGETGLPPVQASRRTAGKVSEYEMQKQEQQQQRRAVAPALHFPVQL